MNRREFQKYLDRDQHCPHCGSTDDTLVPQHRANRGHGGHKAGNQPANVIVLCAAFNTAIEADPLKAETARKYGWKLGRYVEPTEAPYYDMVSGTWWLLDNFFGKRRRSVQEERRTEATPNIARLVSWHLDENGDQYDLANSASIKVLALDIQGILTDAGYAVRG